MNDAKRDFGIEAKAISALTRRKPLEETRQFLEDSKVSEVPTNLIVYKELIICF